MEGWGGISSEEMAVIDENSEWLGVPRTLLMENAGSSIARIVYEWLGGLSGKKVTVFAGTGNNGGDGMAAARHMAGMGAKVTVILVGGEAKTPEASMNLRIIEGMRDSINIIKVRNVEELVRVRDSIEDSEAVVDALLGTGVRGRIREPLRTAISIINSLKAIRVSVDIPSGINPDTGQILDIAVEANITVTLHRPKKGLPSAQDYVGDVVVAPIGIPPEAEYVMGPGDARRAFRAMRGQRRVVMTDDRDVREWLKEFHVPCAEKYESREESVILLGRGEEPPRDENVIVVSEGLREDADISIVGWDEVERMGAEDGALWEKALSVGKIALERNQVIYVLDKEELASDGRTHKAAWVDRPLGEEGRAALKASILALLSCGVEPIKACAAAGYLAGVAEKRGLNGLKAEIGRLAR